MMARHLRWIAVFLVVFTIIEADPLEDSSVSPEEEATDTQDFGKALEDTAYQEEIRGRKNSPYSTVYLWNVWFYSCSFSWSYVSYIKWNQKNEGQKNSQRTNYTQN